MTVRVWSRLCRYQGCRKAFTDRPQFVYCSAECGRFDRGRDQYGRIIRWWLPKYRRNAA